MNTQSQPLNDVEFAPLSIVEIIANGKAKLSATSDSAQLDSQLLLAFVLNKERSYLLAWPERCIDSSQYQYFLELLARREQGEPIAYLTKQKEFWSLPLKTSPATLIPRPDTEVLVEQVLAHHHQASLHCLDLGTGTGAIALALASEQPSWHIDAVDNNLSAVKLAKTNAENLQLTQVNIFQSDWFNSIDTQNRYDIIVSNPPYIDPDDPHLNQGDVRFEPESALVAGNKGLRDIEKIASQARTYFAKQGCLYLEHGFDQAGQVRALLKALHYQNIRTIEDYNGNDRVTIADFIQASL